MSKVVDYSYSHPSPQSIKDAGYIGVVRYLGWDYGYGPRCISPAERDSLLAVGLEIALVWETTATMVLRGRDGGAVDGREANRLADGLGFPADRPIYYAVDFEPSASQFAVIDQYVEGVRSVGARPALMYGNVNVVNRYSDGWQCVAWSYGARTGNARLYQKLGYVLGNTCDENDVLKSDWGQWHADGTVVATPPVVVETPANVVVGTVIELQSDLTLLATHNNDDALNPGQVDGVWGPRTEAALRHFQSTAKDTEGNPLSVDGVAGEKTMAALRVLAYLVGLDVREALVPQAPAVEPVASDPAPLPLADGGFLSLGAVGDLVTFAQNLLVGLGYDVGAVDGVFGDRTDSALKSFQSDHGLVVDGIWGPATRDAVAAAYASVATPEPVAPEPVAPTEDQPLADNRAKPTLAANTSNPYDEVVKLQDELNGLGQSVTVDGVFGPETDLALKNVQSFWGIGADGVYGPVTAQTLSAALDLIGK